jgi:hypothetical protein
MFITIEVSRPIQWLPGWWRCKGITSLRVWWLFFSISIHPMRYDEMIELAGSGSVGWTGTRTTNAGDVSCATCAERDGVCIPYEGNACLDYTPHP